MEKYISKERTGEQKTRISHTAKVHHQSINCCHLHHTIRAVVAMVRDLINKHLEKKKSSNVRTKEKKAAQNRDSKTTRGLLDCMLLPVFATWRLNAALGLESNCLAGRVGGRVGRGLVSQQINDRDIN